MRGRILLVDDQPVLRGLMAGRLSARHSVAIAESGEEALGRLHAEPYDLIIVDVNLPDRATPAVIDSARRLHPGIRTALITSRSMEHCVSFCLRHGIGSILSKTIPFDFEEMDRTVDGLLSGDVFGLGRYLAQGSRLREFRIRQSRDISRVRDRLLRLADWADWGEHRRLVLKLALDESISNAVYHSNGIPKGTDFTFADHQQVLVSFGRDEEKIGVSVVDQAGNLTKETVLRKLDRCMNRAEEHLFEESGRGLFIMRSVVDRLIVNIHRGICTEVILLMYLARREIGHRPILINDLS